MTDIHLALQNKHRFTRVYYLQRPGRAIEILFVLKIPHDSTQDFVVWSQSWLTFSLLSSMI